MNNKKHPCTVGAMQGQKFSPIGIIDTNQQVILYHRQHLVHTLNWCSFYTQKEDIVWQDLRKINILDLETVSAA